MNSRWSDIYMHLKNNNFDVYSPSQHEGECITPYIVVKQNGSSRFPTISSMNDTYILILNVPKNQYSLLEEFVMNVLETMKQLKPMIKFNGSKTPTYYDETIKAHTMSIEFNNVKKL